MLDLGCGYGWHCRFVAEQGAEKVLGLDLSAKMIAEAERQNADAEHTEPYNPYSRISYQVCGIEDYAYQENQWDVVVSNLALHYIEQLEPVFQNVYRTLRAGGVFLFNIEHPVFTAGVGQDWIYDENGRPLYWPVDDYFMPGPRRTHFLGCEVEKQHHTLTQIMTGLLNSGFVIEAVEEAQPAEDKLELPGMKDELRRPMMLMIRAGVRKQEQGTWRSQSS